MLPVSFSEKLIGSYTAIAAKSHGLDVTTSKPDQLIGLTKRDGVLAEVVKAATNDNSRLAIEFYHAVIQHASKKADERSNFLGDEGSQVGGMRNEPLTKGEIKQFYTEFVRRLPANINPAELHEDDIGRFSRANVVLNQLIEQIIGGNEDLAVNLFRATTERIHKHDLLT